MSTARTGLSIGVIVALAVAIWAAVSSGDDEVPPTSSTSSTVSSTTVATSSSTTTTAPTTTSAATSVPATTSPDARLEEVRLILEDLYFRWFDAIYRNDEEAVLDVIATQRYLDDFRSATESLELPDAPERAEVIVTDLEILRDTPECLVTFSHLDLTRWRGDDATVTGVNVLLPMNGEWRLGTAWTHRSDLWESDCLIEPELP